MKQTKEEVNKKEISKLIEPKVIMLCNHCKKKIDQARLMGSSLLCPLCKKSIGQLQDQTKDPYKNITVICKHCGKQIDQASLRGISLICPFCDKPQNGIPHGQLIQ